MEFVTTLKGQKIVSSESRYFTQGSLSGFEITPEPVQKEQVCWPPEQTQQEMKWAQAAVIINGVKTTLGNGHV